MNYKNVLVTGGAGFIGANFVHYMFDLQDFNGRIVNVDSLTYAGNLENLTEISRQYSQSRYFFQKGDISDRQFLHEIFEKYEIDCVVNFAAESHVDRSISGPAAFIQANIVGTFNLVESARFFWKEKDNVRFHHISTDEVYGSLGKNGFFTESTAYDPRSPYSASKASSDHIVRAYYHTYDLPITISNCSNNYGPYQFPEKLIPVVILKILNNESIPVYGDGKNVRDWLYVTDHVEAIWQIVTKGRIGESYNIGGDNEWENIRLVTRICEIVAEELDKDPNSFKKLISFVSDRKGHDRRYAIDCSKLKNELNWKQRYSFDTGLKLTVKWYLDNMNWVANIVSENYRSWMRQNYENR